MQMKSTGKLITFKDMFASLFLFFSFLPEFRSCYSFSEVGQSLITRRPLPDNEKNIKNPCKNSVVIEPNEY